MKKITKIRLMERMRVRYGLEELTPEMFAVIEKVLPVTSIDELAREHGILQASTLSVSSTGYKTALTVPAGERYKVTAIYFDLASGTFDFNEYRVTDVSLNSQFFFEDALAAAVADWRIWCTQPIVLEEGDHIDINIFSVGAAGALITKVYGYKEDLF